MLILWDQPLLVVRELVLPGPCLFTKNFFKIGYHYRCSSGIIYYQESIMDSLYYRGTLGLNPCFEMTVLLEYFESVRSIRASLYGFIHFMYTLCLFSLYARFISHTTYSNIKNKSDCKPVLSEWIWCDIDDCKPYWVTFTYHELTDQRLWSGVNRSKTRVCSQQIRDCCLKYLDLL